MAFDGILLSLVKYEISDFAIGCRVDKIHQPSAEEVILSLRSREGAKKLLLSCRADSARVHFTEFSPENPKKPPMFTMLLRKRLQGARVNSISQDGLERALTIELIGTNELGDKVTYYLITEIMGRSSNIILIDSDKIIVDAVKRVDISEGASRVIMPKEKYIAPPKQDKYNIFTDDINDIENKIHISDLSPSKAAMNTLLGVSPIICREFECGLTVKSLLDFAKNPTPTVIIDEMPRDFTFLPINQYGNTASNRTFDDFSSMLDYFFYERVRLARIKSRSAALFKTLGNLSERAYRKAENRRVELKECKDKDKYRIYGDLITSNQYSLKKGSLYYDVENYYDNQNIIRIPADVKFSPSQNAQKYYKEYRKKQVAEEKLNGLIEEAMSQGKYLDSVIDMLSRAETDSEITAIKEELPEEGYIKNRGINKKATLKLGPKEYISTEGYKILVGRNNVMNDRLTLKTAKGNDLWLHTQDTPGSHVIVVSDGKAFTDKVIHEGAVIAAFNSKAATSSNVPVDYTLVKFVKKPSGAKPGKVIYTDFKTEFVTPTVSEIERLNKIV